MSRLSKKTTNKVGAAPGTLVHLGEQKTQKVGIRQVTYTAEVYQHADVDAETLLNQPTDPAEKRWLKVDGLHDTDLIQKIGEHFAVHPLTLEDILNTHHRPKVNDHDRYLWRTQQ